MTTKSVYKEVAMTSKQVTAMRLVLRLMSYSTVIDIIMGVSERNEDGVEASRAVLLATENTRIMDSYLLRALELAYVKAGGEPLATSLVSVKMPVEAVDVFVKLMKLPRTEATYKLAQLWGDDYIQVRDYVEAEAAGALAELARHQEPEATKIPAPAVGSVDGAVFTMAQPKGKQ